MGAKRDMRLALRTRSTLLFAARFSLAWALTLQADRLSAQESVPLPAITDEQFLAEDAAAEPPLKESDSLPGDMSSSDTLAWAGLLTERAAI